jgi:Zn-dependent protease with chaperone function
MSLTTRAIVALLLMIGFYVLALGIAGGLLWLAYADWAYRNSIDRLEIALVIAAGLILWSILPRVDRFEAPGPLVNREREPRLFAEISSIAQATGQEMPHEVYFIPEVNAWVAQRGGIGGMGSRRIMALGVPLMALLTVSQFRAVLAHEFGHYHAGDTKLSPWVYKTRVAILRTVKNLSSHRSYLAYLSYLFKWYAEMFLRVTLAISRAQEYAADQLAARFAGSKALAEGLKQLHRGDTAWMTYLRNEVGPVLSAGFLPPLSPGLSHFLAAPQISRPVEASLQEELAQGKADPFDSHPSLRERLAALEETASSANQDPRPCLDLLDDLQSADSSFVSAAGIDQPLRPVSWDDTLEKVWQPEWQQRVSSQREVLQGVYARDLGELFASGELGKRLKDPPGVYLTTEQRRDMASGLAGCALALALYRSGWAFHTLPGEAYCEKNGRRLEPFALTADLKADKVAQEKWKELCEASGISDLSLQVEAAAAAPTK